MKKKLVLSLSCLPFLYLAGCANSQSAIELDRNATEKAGRVGYSLVQTEELKAAISKLIRDTADIRSKMDNIATQTSAIKTQADESDKKIADGASKIDSLSVRVSSIEQNATQKPDAIIAPVVVIKEQQRKSSGVCDKAAKIKIRRASLLDKPGGLHIKYAKKNERYCYSDLESGYFHLSTSGLFLSEKDAEQYTPITKKQIKKSNGASDGNKTQSQNATKKSDSKSEFFLPDNQQVAQQIVNGDVAKEIARELVGNPNVNDANIKEQCAAALLKRGLTTKGRQPIIESCSANWKLIITKERQ